MFLSVFGKKRLMLSIVTMHQMQIYSPEYPQERLAAPGALLSENRTEKLAIRTVDYMQA